MTDVTVQAITSILLAIINGVVLYFMAKINHKIDEVKKATDGLTSELVNTTRSDSLQKGRTAGIEEQKEKQLNGRQRTSDAPAPAVTVNISTSEKALAKAEEDPMPVTVIQEPEDDPLKVKVEKEKK